MSQFPRQKRQARSYWAELGFLVLGLFALQPNLLSSLVSGTHNNSSPYAERTSYPGYQNVSNPNSQNWQANSLGSMYWPSYQNPANGQQAWPNSAMSSSYIQPMQTSYQQSNPRTAVWDYNSNQPGSLPTSYGFPYQNSQPSEYTARNSWSAPPSYGNQTAGYSAAGTQFNGQLTDYSENTNRGSTYSSNPYAGSSNPYAVSSSNPFSSLVTKPQPYSLFGGGSKADSYLSERPNSTSQRFGYPTNSSSSNTFTPYRPSMGVYR